MDDGALLTALNEQFIEALRRGSKRLQACVWALAGVQQ